MFILYSLLTYFQQVLQWHQVKHYFSQLTLFHLIFRTLTDSDIVKKAYGGFVTFFPHHLSELSY